MPRCGGGHDWQWQDGLVTIMIEEAAKARVPTIVIAVKEACQTYLTRLPRALHGLRARRSR
jgi:hypothetical protein